MTQADPDESRSESNLLARRAFTILAGALCAHALLQTGRDATFLARIPPPS